MNTNINTITARQLRDALAIREQIEALEQQFKRILQPATEANGGAEVPLDEALAKPKRRRMSPKARRAIGRAQRARWRAWHREQVSVDA